MHALFDRRDLTEARNADAGHAPVGDAGLARVVMELARTVELLQHQLLQVRSGPHQMSVTNANPAEAIMENWPVPGARRFIVRRTGAGVNSLVIPTAGVLVMPQNEARLGSQWTNSGSFPIRIFLSDQARTGAPTVFLAAGGGSWDGRFGNLPWAGDIFAAAFGGASTLDGGEL